MKRMTIGRKKKRRTRGASTRSVSRIRNKDGGRGFDKIAGGWRSRRTIRDAEHPRARACRVRRLLTSCETHQLDLSIANRSWPLVRDKNVGVMADFVAQHWRKAPGEFRGGSSIGRARGAIGRESRRASKGKRVFVDKLEIIFSRYF